jgi:hypothetical protein
LEDIVMKLIRSCRGALILIAVILLGLYGFQANAASAAAPRVSTRFVPIEGNVTLSNGDIVFFSGQVHVLTRATFSDAGVPTVDMYVNLIGVEGTSAATGNNYLLVGAANVEWVGTSPGPPDIPEQTFSFSPVQINPGPPDLPPSPILPVFLRNFVFAQEAGSEGVLLSVEVSFLSD